jgi:hypothetical protein
MLISILKMTKKGAAKQEQLNSDAKVPSITLLKLLQKLQNEGLLYLKDDCVESFAEGRLSLAMKALQAGADVELVSALLDWREFEAMASLALDYNGYVTLKNLHFTHVKKRWEIDIVGCKKPLVVCIDCKHWNRALKPASLRIMVESQIARVEAFAESLPIKKHNVVCSKWEKSTFIPVIVSLVQSSFKLYSGVPIVPVLQIQDFVHNLPLNLDSVKTISRKFEHL